MQGRDDLVTEPGLENGTPRMEETSRRRIEWGREFARLRGAGAPVPGVAGGHRIEQHLRVGMGGPGKQLRAFCKFRSEEHTSELQSRENLVCRLLLEKKKEKAKPDHTACIQR